jgi:deoxyribodipyrimidine photo-lyase
LNQRMRVLNDAPATSGPVVYWMSRDQRVNDNWAFLYAQTEAVKRKQPLVVVFCKSPEFLGASRIHYHFMMQGLFQVAEKLKTYAIPFCILEGDPVKNIIHLVTQIEAGLLVTDFSPLKIARLWKQAVTPGIGVRVTEVDAHNIVPCFEASDKQEFSAFTFRRKYYQKFNEWMDDFSEVMRHPFFPEPSLLESLKQWSIFNERATSNEWDGHVPSGETAAREKLRDFINHRLCQYHLRNNPNEDVCSGLSPYLHFGQISARRIAGEIFRENIGAAGFLEELIIRRELADNFCFFNKIMIARKGFRFGPGKL